MKNLILLAILLPTLAIAQPNKHTPACDSPNPPWWCEEQEEENPAVSIDKYLIFGVVVAIGLAAWRLKKLEDNERNN